MTHTRAPAEPVEAVIISSPLKGQFVTLTDGKPQLSTAEEEALRLLAEGMTRAAESARAAVAEVDVLLRDLRAIRTG